MKKIISKKKRSQKFNKIKNIILILLLKENNIFHKTKDIKKEIPKYLL